MNKELIKKSLITNSVTFRENIKLPSLPSDKEGLNNIPIIDMPRSELIENNLVFELPNGFKKALELGFFLIKIPNITKFKEKIYTKNYLLIKNKINLLK